LIRSLRLRQNLLRKLRQALLSIVIPLPPVQRKITITLSGLGVRYKTGDGKLAGVRMPDMELMNAEHEKVRLYKLLSFPGYTLLLSLVQIKPSPHVNRSSKYSAMPMTC
jgi:hypothetical protein